MEADDKTVTISVTAGTYQRLRERAAASDVACDRAATVEEYVFDLVARDAYAPSRWVRLSNASPSTCLPSAVVLLAAAWLTDTWVLLRVAFVLANVPWVLMVAERIAEGPRRKPPAPGRVSPAADPPQL